MTHSTEKDAGCYGLPTGPFDVIVADPPWRYNNTTTTLRSGGRVGAGMTGPEHYRAAEGLLESAADAFALEDDIEGHNARVAAAQVHATLALAAAAAVPAANAYDGDEDHSRSRGWAGVA